MTINGKSTLPETNIFTPENGWLEYFFGSFWDGQFSGAISFREGSINPKNDMC